ncbi:MAG: hypothetical protein EA378_02400 [Phycisphaerales bacterium]|nr:MAG: hypothetical protein EA378_02400 [Phycisphaerales bacterium]
MYGTSLKITPTLNGFETSGPLSARFGLHPKGPQKPDPSPAGWSWDGAELDAWTDRLGFVPVFYGVIPHDRSLVVGNNPLDMIELGVSRAADDRAIAAFLRLGYFLGEDTPFQHMRALPPGGRLRWSGQEPRVSGGHLPTPESERQPASRDDAMDQYIELFRAAIQYRLPGDDGYLLPLTGGRDSRHILLELLRQGRPPERCLTVRPHPGARIDEAGFAAELAERFGLQHVSVVPKRPMIACEFVKNRHTGLLTDEGPWAMMLRDHIAQAHPGSTRLAYDGIAGDSLSASTFLTPARDAMYRSRDFDGIIASLTPLTAQESAIQSMLPRSLQDRLGYAVARERMIDELERHTEAANPFGMFIFWNRTRREIALVPHLLMQGVCDFHTPFLDDDLFDFLSGLNVQKFRLDGGLHQDVIDRAYPEAKNIPYFQKGMGRAGRLPAGAIELLRAIPQLIAWQLRHDPQHASLTVRWAATRLTDRNATRTAPRRMVQYFAHLLSIASFDRETT